MKWTNINRGKKKKKVQSKFHCTEDRNDPVRQAIVAHFTDEEKLSLKQLSDLPKISQLVNGRGGIQIHVSLFQKVPRCQRKEYGTRKLGNFQKACNHLQKGNSENCPEEIQLLCP